MVGLVYQPGEDPALKPSITSSLRCGCAATPRSAPEVPIFVVSDDESDDEESTSIKSEPEMTTKPLLTTRPVVLTTRSAPALDPKTHLSTPAVVSTPVSYMSSSTASPVGPPHLRLSAEEVYLQKANAELARVQSELRSASMEVQTMKERVFAEAESEVSSAWRPAEPLVYRQLERAEDHQFNEWMDFKSQLMKGLGCMGVAHENQPFEDWQLEGVGRILANQVMDRYHNWARDWEMHFKRCRTPQEIFDLLVQRHYLSASDIAGYYYELSYLTPGLSSKEYRAYESKLENLRKFEFWSDLSMQITEWTKFHKWPVYEAWVAQNVSKWYEVRRPLTSQEREQSFMDAVATARMNPYDYLSCLFPETRVNRCTEHEEPAVKKRPAPATDEEVKPKRSKKSPKPDSICYSCQGKGHWAYDCPQKDHGSSTTPTKKPQAISKPKFPNDASKQAIPPHTIASGQTNIETNAIPIQPKAQTICYYCRESGHWVKDCPKTGNCYMCGERGHRAKQCQLQENLAKLTKKEKRAFLKAQKRRKAGEEPTTETGVEPSPDMSSKASSP
ncbi:hypothetical protein DICA4_E23552 [Diutina catenulata]